MSHAVKQSVQRVPLGEDWVDLRLPVLYGLRNRIREKLAGLTVDEEGHVRSGAAQLAAANLEVLLGTVVDWGGPGFCRGDEHPHADACVKLPITAETINSLDEVVEQILNEIEARNKGATPDFTKPSMPPSALAAQAGPTESA